MRLIRYNEKGKESPFKKKKTLSSESLHCKMSYNYYCYFCCTPVANVLHTE